MKPGSEPGFPLRLLLAQFGQNRLAQIVAEVKSLFREPLENRPRGRDQSGLPGLHDDPRGADHRDSEPLRLAAGLQIVQQNQGSRSEPDGGAQGAGFADIELRQRRLAPFLPQQADPALLDRCGDRDRSGQLARAGRLASDLPGDRDRLVELAQPGKAADACKRDERARIRQDYLARLALTFLRSSRSVLALPRITGMPARPISTMNASSGMPATLAARPIERLSLL